MQITEILRSNKKAEMLTAMQRKDSADGEWHH